MHILIADDSATIRKVVRSYLEQNSAWYICCENNDFETIALVAVLRRSFDAPIGARLTPAGAFRAGSEPAASDRVQPGS